MKAARRESGSGVAVSSSVDSEEGAMPLEILTLPTPNGWKVTIMIEELREADIDLGDVQIRTIDLGLRASVRRGP